MDRTSRQSATTEELIAAVAVVAILYFGRTIFVPITLAVLLSFVLYPAVALLRRLYFGQALSVFTVVFIAACLVLGLGTVIARQLTELATLLPNYEKALTSKIKRFENGDGISGAADRLSGALHRLGQEIEQKGDSKGGDAQLTPTAPRPVPVEIRQPEWELWDRYRSILIGFSEPLSTAAIVLIYLVFVMLQREELRDRIIKLAGPKSVPRSTAALDDAGSRLSRYFLAQTAINSVFGCIIGAALALIGLPNAILFGAVAGLMRFVPFAGSIIAAIVPLTLAAAIEPGWATFIWTLILYAAGETAASQVAEPLLYRHSTGISAFAVIVSATFWTWLWGAIGLVMAVPLTVCLAVLAKHVESFEFLHILLTDAPALSPPQALYQRLLAGNAGEALRDAEKYLKSNSLSQYYSQAVIPGLALAHADWERGVLNRQRLLELSETAVELIESLDGYDDAPPQHQNGQQEGGSEPPALPAPPAGTFAEDWKDGEVLAMGGRTPCDAAGAAILAQLLNKHGVPAYALPPAETGPRLFRSPKLPAAPLIAISYFGGTGAYAHIRSMLRHTHKLRPGARLLVCCWDGADETGSISGLLAGDAPACATTLHDAVKQVLAAAQSEIASKPADEAESAEERH